VYISLSFDKGIELCIRYHSTTHPKVPSKVFWHKQMNKTIVTTITALHTFNWIPKICIWSTWQVECDWLQTEPTIFREPNTQKNTIKHTHFSTLISLSFSFLKDWFIWGGRCTSTHMSGVGQRERERSSDSLLSSRRAWSPDPEILTWAETKSQMFNWATQAPHHTIS